MAQNPDVVFLHEVRDGKHDLPVAVTVNNISLLFGARVTAFDHAAMSIEVACDLGATFANGNGVVQGGLLSAVLDFGMAYAVLAQLQPHETMGTINLDTHFLRPCPAGLVTVRGQVIKMGRQVVFAEGRVVDARGKTVADGASSCLIVPMPDLP